MQQDREVLTCI